MLIRIKDNNQLRHEIRKMKAKVHEMEKVLTSIKLDKFENNELLHKRDNHLGYFYNNLEL